MTNDERTAVPPPSSAAKATVMLPTSRKEALALGLPRFNTGHPCKYGHMADRYAKRSDCVTCRDLLFKRWYESNSQRVVESAVKWRAKNAEIARPRGVAVSACCRARRRNALPKWADLRSIREFYEKCPPGLEVDHVIPLNGKDVCGLHVVENLQYLTVGENRRKCNRYEAC